MMLSKFFVFGRFVMLIHTHAEAQSDPEKIFRAGAAVANSPLVFGASLEGAPAQLAHLFLTHTT